MPATKKKKPNPSSSAIHKRYGRRNIMIWLDAKDYEMVQRASIDAVSPMSQFAAWATISAAKSILEKSEKSS